MALTIVGTVVGTYFGAPQLGAMLGSIAGSVVEGAMAGGGDKRGVKSSDMAVQVSTYGHPINKVWGSMVVAGDLIWVGPRKKREKQVSSKGGFGGTGSSFVVYRQSFMVGLCEAPVCDVLKIWMDAKLVYDKTGKSKVKKRYSSLKIRFYYGGEDNTPDELIEAERGIGLVPAFKHLCAIMFEGLPLRDYGNRVPNVRALVVTECEDVTSAVFIEDFPEAFRTQDSLILDPRAGYDYAYFPMFRGRQVDENGHYDYLSPGYMCAVNGHTNTTEIKAAVANYWGAPGPPDISQEGQLAWVGEHNAKRYQWREKVASATCVLRGQGADATGARQTVRLFNAPQMIAGTPAEREQGSWDEDCLSAVCTTPTQQVRSPSFRFSAGGNHTYLWAWLNSSLANGDVWLMWAPGGGSLHSQGGPSPYLVRETFGGGSGAFTTNTFRLKDIDTDDQGTAYILWSNVNRTHIYRVVPSNRPFLVCSPLEALPPAPPMAPLLPGTDVELSAVFPNASIIIYYPPDHSLIIGRRGYDTGMLKWSLEDEAIVATLDIRFQRNLQSFHHARRTHQHTLWIGDMITDMGHTAANGLHNFPRFREVNLDSFTITRTEVMYSAGDLYPPRNALRFPPANALYSPEQDALWSESISGWTIAKFDTNKASACPTLQSVVEEICAMTGKLDVATQVDASALAEDKVCGYVLDHQRPARELLEELSIAYFFNGRERDGKLQFVKRTGASLVTIPADDLAAYEEGSSMPEATLKEVRQQEIELPRDVQMLFFNPDRDYEQDSVQEIRNARVVETTERATINIPIVFTQSEAKRICSVIARERWVQRATYEALLPPLYQRLDVLDAVTVTLEDGTQRLLRWTEINEGANGILEMKGVDHHPEIYADLPAIGGGAPGGGHVGGTLNGIAPSALYLLDTPLLHDTDNVNNPFYFGVGPVNDADRWGGAEVLRSIDQGVTWDAYSQQAVAATAGWTLTALGAPAAWTVWDERNTVDVRLISGELFNASKLDVLNGANAVVVGDEIIQFRTAQLLSSEERRYRLSGLLRGRRGTEWAIHDHTAQEQVIVLDPNSIKRETLPLSDFGVRRDYRAVTAELTIEDSTLTTLTWQARSVKPYAVAHAKAVRLETGALLVTWLRRSRVGVAWQSGADPDLAEASEAYEVDVIFGDEIVRTLTSIMQSVTYTVAQQADDRLALTDAPGFAIYQMSAAVGRGFAATVSLIPGVEVEIPAPSVPAAPTVSVVTFSSTAIDVTITVPDPHDINGTKVERSPNGTSGWAQLSPILGPTETLLHDTALMPATPYHYRARTFNEAGHSPYSNVETDTTDAAPIAVPSAPTLLSVEAVSSGRINGNFTDTSGNETSFEVWRSVNGGAFAKRLDLLPNVTTFSDIGLTASTLYAYKVLAKNSAGSSAFSNTDSDTTDPIIIVGPGTFFWSTTGNNTTGTGSITNPFKTIARGLQAVGPGGTLYGRGGTYAEAITNPPSGTSWTSAVRIAAYNGETVTIQPTSGRPLSLTYQGTPIRYLIFEGLVFDGNNTTVFPVNIDGVTFNSNNIRYIRLLNVEVKNGTGSGVLTGRGADFLEFIGGRYHDNGDGGSVRGYGIYLQSSDCLIDGGEFYGNFGFGIHIYNGFAGQSNNRNTVRKVKIYDNGFGLILGSGDGNSAYNCLIYGQTDVTGYALGVGFNATNTRVFHNTVYDNAADGLHIRYFSSGTLATNNIFYSNGVNIFVDARVAATTTLTNNLTANPTFVNAGAFDFHLQSTSVAIGAGVAMPTVLDDLEGNIRPVNGLWDQGCLQFYP